MNTFVGRQAELSKLQELLDETRSGRGVLVSVRGRRQVGKSRLVSEFVDRANVPTVFFTASQQPGPVELAQFAQVAQTAGVESAAAFAGGVGSWEAALELVAADAVPGRPVVVVIDELPYLAISEPAIEAILQKVWQSLERKPILLILIGSDIAMMSALTEYGRPLYGRAREFVVNPLTVHDIAQMAGLSPAGAFDAYLVLGGLPRLALLWKSKDTVMSFIKRELSDETSPLIVLGERMLAAEFPADLNARAVLGALGAGERTHGTLMTRSGVGRGIIDKALGVLIDKRVVQRATPYAAPGSDKLPRYTVADPYLRFWLRFVHPAIELIARGRADLAVDRFTADWPTYRGRAIEPLIRASLERMLPTADLGRARFVGSYWTKDNRVEVDLVGGRDPGQAGMIEFVGSIKWRDKAPFDSHDVADLMTARHQVPGVTRSTRLVGVSRSGFTGSGLDIELDAEALLSAWRSR